MIPAGLARPTTGCPVYQNICWRRVTPIQPSRADAAAARHSCMTRGKQHIFMRIYVRVRCGSKRPEGPDHVSLACKPVYGLQQVLRAVVQGARVVCLMLGKGCGAAGAQSGFIPLPGCPRAATLNPESKAYGLLSFTRWDYVGVAWRVIHV